MKLLSTKKGAFSMDNFIETVLGVFVFTALIGTVAAQIVSAQNNLTGGAAILLGLTTLILVIGFIMAIYKSHKGGR